MCGYQPASVAARDAPTAAPRISAKASTGLKSPFVPRPPETTIEASVNSGRPPLTAGCVDVTTPSLAASEIVGVKSSVVGAALPAIGSIELARIVAIVVP